MIQMNEGNSFFEDFGFVTFSLKNHGGDFRYFSAYFGHN